MLDDPVGNSFLQGEFEGDTCLTEEHYQRSPEQEEKYVGTGGGVASQESGTDTQQNVSVQTDSRM